MRRTEVCSLKKELFMRRILAFAALPFVMCASLASGHGVQIQLTYNANTNKIETRQIMTGSADVVPFGYSRETFVSPITRAYVAPLTHITNFSQSGSPGFGPLPANDGWYANYVPLLKTGVPTIKYPSGAGVSWQYDTNATVPGTFTGTPAPIAGTGWALNGYTGSPALVNLSGKSFGLRFTSGLRAWNGSGFVDAGNEQLQAFSGDATSAIVSTTPRALTDDATTDNGAGPSFINTPVGTTWSNAPHFSWSFRILGNGVDDTVAPDDGVYLAQYRVYSNASDPGGSTTIGESDIVSLLLFKNASLTEQQAAVASLNLASSQVQYAYTPEPASLVVMASVFTVLLKRRRAS
jgi:hypothetical protein